MRALARKPGTIRYERSGPWQAELHRFQPLWCSSSPTFGITFSCTIRAFLGVNHDQGIGLANGRAFV
jgi:hypothetical protein